MRCAQGSMVVDFVCMCVFYRFLCDLEFYLRRVLSCVGLGDYIVIQVFSCIFSSENCFPEWLCYFPFLPVQLLLLFSVCPYTHWWAIGLHVPLTNSHSHWMPVCHVPRTLLCVLSTAVACFNLTAFPCVEPEGSFRRSRYRLCQVTEFESVFSSSLSWLFIAFLIRYRLKHMFVSIYLLLRKGPQNMYTE